MKNIIEKFWKFVDKIGKPNFVLVVLILFFIAITGLYQTFSLYTSSDGATIVDGVKNYQFILNNDNTENTVLVPANSSKKFHVTISNSEDKSLKYGVYYNSTSDLSYVNLGYLKYSTYQPNGVIPSNGKYEVSLRIDNHSDNDVSIKIGVSYGLENGGDLELSDNSHWFLEASDLLSDMAIGSYVKYVGNNGCTGKSCRGQNANYVSDTDMGYCYNSNYKYNANGWRIAYIKDGTAYLISAGSPECVCTDSSGTAGTSCSSNETTAGLSRHIANLNAKALAYCNSTYAYGGKCDSNSAWNMTEADFKAITGATLSTANNKSGYESYSLINNGGWYWYAKPTSTSSTYAFGWEPGSQYVSSYTTYNALGSRPVLRLASSVEITGGTGTYEDPYTIKISKLLSKVEVNSYVKYTGSNGCKGKSCEGQNANYVSDTNMGYCYHSGYKYNANGWRIAYIKDGTAYLTSAGSPECMCTSSNGTAGTSCSDSDVISETILSKHIANLNAKALTYCNGTYAYGGKCDSNSAWNMANADFKAITGNTLSAAFDESDGYYDSYSIINNGGFYWFATLYDSRAFYWDPRTWGVARNNGLPYLAYGIRPVLRLQSSVEITGGFGTYEDPYTISNGKTMLSEVAPGSYVKYTGNNGCLGDACKGQNANYVSDTNMGYCYNSGYKYNANGWRIAYTKEGTAYLTSAGSPECMCTNSAGTAGTNCGDSHESTDGVPKHLANLKKKALTYCNSTYAYGGKCDSASAWNMANADFKAITADSLNTAFDKANYDNYSIINNGGFYWFATPYSSSFPNAFNWNSGNRSVRNATSHVAYGLRPVLRLQSSVVVTGGSGTYQDPYTISNG
ncbi:MAG: hypothetical protein SO108_02195 [Bacilli bacterium]|nr:hypothetical protein [Bacilli bacterium]